MLHAAHFSIGNVLNEHFWIELRGDGQLTFYSTSTTDVRSVGAAALNKWLRFKVEFIAPPYSIRMSVTGDGVNESIDWGFIAAGAPSFLYVGVSPAANLPDGAGLYGDDILVSDEPPVPTLPTTWGHREGAVPLLWHDRLSTSPFHGHLHLGGGGRWHLCYRFPGSTAVARVLTFGHTVDTRALGQREHPVPLPRLAGPRRTAPLPGERRRWSRITPASDVRQPPSHPAWPRWFLPRPPRLPRCR